MTSLERAKEIVKVLDKKKAKDIKLLEITNLSSLGDYFIIASGSSTTQVKSMSEEVEDAMTKLGEEPNRVEGHQTAQWILLDYYDVMVHVFLDETREFYNLERLWCDAPAVDISDILTQNQGVESKTGLTGGQNDTVAGRLMGGNTNEIRFQSDREKMANDMG